jgi:polysaccharide export outer membrane protein
MRLIGEPEAPNAMSTHGVHPVHKAVCSSWLSAVIAVTLLGSLGACNREYSANWFKNGFLDPTEVGNFETPVTSEIRESVSILEEPTGIQNAEDPSETDLLPEFAEQRIGPGDVLNVSIFEVLMPGQATGVQVRVGNSGFETLPVVGRIPMVGLTAREAELEIKERLREMEVLPDADVQVSILQSPGHQISIVGSISRPGVYPLPRPEYRLLDAIAAAGGIAPIIEKVYVFRPATAEPPRTRELPPPAQIQPQPPAEAVPFTMSEASRGRAATPDDTEDDEPPATSKSTINELDILNGEPTGDAPLPRWDPERGDWVIGDATTATAPSSEMPTTMQEVQPPPEQVAITSQAADAEDEEHAQEEGTWWESEAMQPPVRILEIPVKELMDGDPRYNVCLRAGDIVRVPAGSVGEFYLGGNVARPGAYGLTGRRITVKQAIVSAGGFGPLAWPARAELIRRIGENEEHYIQLDLDAIFAGKAPDFYLKPNDIVNVGTAPWTPFLAVLRNAFRFSYGMAFVYDRNFADSDTFSAREQVKNRRANEARLRGLPAS